MLTELESSTLKSTCNNILKEASLLGVFSHAALSSVVGNRVIEFRALYADGSQLETASDKGYLLTTKNGGTRVDFKKYYSDSFVTELTSKKLLAYWLIWSVDASGNSANLIGQLADAFLEAGVEAPLKILKIVTIRSTKKGVKNERTVKRLYTLDVLKAEVLALCNDVDARKIFIANSPTRSEKYSHISDDENEDSELTPVESLPVDAKTLLDFEM